MLTARQPIGGAVIGAAIVVGPSVLFNEELDRVEHSGGIQASLSGRYATALFELARDTKSIDMVEASLARVSGAIAQSPEFAALIASPIVSRTDAAKAIAASAELIDLDDTTEKFLGVLA